jgi:dolichyl-phosphate-mannose-protein mannosyltransferase
MTRRRRPPFRPLAAYHHRVTLASTTQSDAPGTDPHPGGADHTVPPAGPPAADRATPAGSSDAPSGRVPAIVRRRLVDFDNRLDARSWLATLLVVAIAAVLRLANLGHPKGKIFDELYYATDAYNLLTRGVEWDEKNNTAAYVVHPPLGKWMIALGEWAFGYNEFGWRISAAVAGIVSVLLLTRIARRLFHSTILGCAAGLLLAVDGFHLVLSRTALLDIFLLLFVLAAFGALVLDRDARRRRWLRAMEAGLDPSRPGRAGRLPLVFPDSVPWWRLLAAVLLGCAASVKWSALYFVLLFVLLILLWEVGARKSAGVRRPWVDTLIGEFGWLVLFGVVVGATYLASWSGWFLTDIGYFRHWRADTGQSEPPVIGALLNLFHYHHEAYKFHTGLVTTHPYQSWPWQWLLLGRPVAFHWVPNATGCGAPSCAEEILLLGTPLLWWSFLPALIALGWFAIARRDWRAWTILAMVAAGLLPWFWYALDGRTMFSFYTAPALPFMVLAVVYILGAIIGPSSAGSTAAVPAAGAGDGTDTGDDAGAGDESRRASADRRLIGTIVAGTYVLLVVICFAYFYPIFVGQLIPYADWSARMWLGGRWI